MAKKLALKYVFAHLSFSGQRQKIVPPPASLTAEMHEKKTSTEVELQLVKNLKSVKKISKIDFFFHTDFAYPTYQYG